MFYTCVKENFLGYKIDQLLLGLWKMFYYCSKNRHVLAELQKVYGIKTLQMVKIATTRWLSHGAVCKRCIERYSIIP